MLELWCNNVLNDMKLLLYPQLTFKHNKNKMTHWNQWESELNKLHIVTYNKRYDKQKISLKI